MGENATIAVITSVLSTVDDDVTVGYIRREPELSEWYITCRNVRSNITIIFLLLITHITGNRDVQSSKTFLHMC